MMHIRVIREDISVDDFLNIDQNTYSCEPTTENSPILVGVTVASVLLNLVFIGFAYHVPMIRGVLRHVVSSVSHNTRVFLFGRLEVESVDRNFSELHGIELAEVTSRSPVNLNQQPTVVQTVRAEPPRLIEGMSYVLSSLNSTEQQTVVSQHIPTTCAGIPTHPAMVQRERE